MRYTQRLSATAHETLCDIQGLWSGYLARGTASGQVF